MLKNWPIVLGVFLSTAASAQSLSPAGNLLQNSGMQIAVLNSTNAVTIVNPPGGGITVDRWRFDMVGSMGGSIQQSSDAPPGFVASIKVSISTAEPSLGASDLLSFFQTLEGSKMAPLGWGTSAAQDISCGWWSKWHQAGQHGGVVKNYNGSRTWAFAYTITTVGAWEFHTTTITGDTSPGWNNADGTIWGYLLLNVASGSNFQITPGTWHAGNAANASGSVNGVDSTSDYAQFTGVMCFVGDTPPTAAQSASLLRPDFAELKETERYYRKRYQPPLNGGVNTGGTECVHLRMPLDPPMAKKPTTIRIVGRIPVSDGPNLDTLVDSGTGSASPWVDSSTANALDLNVATTNHTLTAGRPCYPYTDGGGSYVEMYAEPGP